MSALLIRLQIILYTCVDKDYIDPDMCVGNKYKNEYQPNKEEGESVNITLYEYS